jgi:hypothetical protein
MHLAHEQVVREVLIIHGTNTHPFLDSKCMSLAFLDDLKDYTSAIMKTHTDRSGLEIEMQMWHGRIAISVFPFDALSNICIFWGWETVLLFGTWEFLHSCHACAGFVVMA